MGCRAASALLLFACLFAGSLAAQQPGPLQSVLAAPLVPAVATGIEIAVERPDGKPAANAIVAVLPASWTAEQRDVLAAIDAQFANDANERLAAVALRFGECRRADENGRVVVPAGAARVASFAPGGPASAAAFVPGLAGELAFDAPPTAPGRVRLLAKRSLWVRVLDADGKPVAGLAVASRPNFATTDARGECVLALRDGTSGHEVGAAIAGADVTAGIDHRRLPRTPITLRLPPHGFVRVLAYDEQEQPRDDLASVDVRWSDGREGIAVRRDAKGDFVVRAAVGVPLEVRATLRGAAGAVTATCAGPTRAGELVICDVRATQGPPVLVFRVLGLDGKALTDGNVMVSFRREWWEGGQNAPVGADGRVRIPVDEPENVREIAVLRRLHDAGWPVASLGGATVPRPPRWRAGEIALLDVRLVEEPVAVAGVVVGADGKPFPDAQISVGMRIGPPRFDLWHPLAQNLRPQADGRFEVRDLRAGGSLQVFASAHDHQLVRLDVDAGAGDVRLVLQREGRVRLVLDGVPDVQHELLHAALVPAGTKGDGVELRFTSGAAWVRASPGRYDLVLSLRRNDFEVARIPDVSVEAGVDTDDPRLMPWPWREHLLPVTITTVDEAGRPVSGAMIMCMFLKPDGSGGGGGGLTDGDGRYFALVPRTGATFRFDPTNGDGGSDCRPVEMANVTTDQRFVLRPRLRANVRVQGDPRLPAELKSAWLVQPKRVDGMVQRGGQGERPAADGTLALKLDAPGTYQILLQVRVPIDERKSRYVAIPWGTFDVRETPGLQTATVTASEAAVERLAALREQFGKH